MLDVLIRGGMVVDGTGSPGRVADVGVRAGRVVTVGAIDEPAHRVIDADGRVVAPGFVDLHTHYDAQVFFDTTLSPSPLHGVTTVIGGNCGFTIAPLAASADDNVRDDDADYLMRMLARVEGMPLASLREGVPWDWTTFQDYLARIDGTLAPNAGFLVGHCALRRVVMGEDATKGAANDDQLRAMERLLGESLAAGGLGFSSSWARTHNDAGGEMVPLRHATDDELIALCRVTGRHPGTTLEFIPGVPPFEEYAPDVMARMSAAANRPLNWNVLFVGAGREDVIDRLLEASDTAREHGGRVLALTMPDTASPRICFDNGFLLDTIPGWERPMALPHDEKKALLASKEGRAALIESSTHGKQVFGIANWGNYVINEVINPANRRFEGRSVADIANELDKDPFDALLDIVVDDDLMTGFGFPPSGRTTADWEARVKVWRDERAIVGASDAGAHLDFLATFNYSTAMLGYAVREQGLMPIEEAIHLLTDVPARLYGLRDRGRIAPGWFADIVVLDPDTIGPGEVRMRFDLPAGAARLYGDANGIDRVLVNGTEIVAGGEFTDARPGTLLRSGRDTETVTARP